MSSNGETPVVLQGVTHGAVDFLIKPVRIEELRNLWQHVIRRRKELVGTLAPPDLFCVCMWVASLSYGKELVPSCCSRAHLNASCSLAVIL